MSSSSDCSDEDDGKQPSSLLEYWDRIRPSSTDEDSEPEVSPVRNQPLEASNTTECQQNENNDIRNENSQAEETTPSQTSSMSHTNQSIPNITPVSVHSPQTEDTHNESRDEIIENVNSSWHLLPVPDSSYRPAVHDTDQEFIMHQQWRSDTDLLPENNFKDHCCWHCIQSDQFRSFYRCSFVFFAFVIFFYFSFRYG